MPHIHTEPGQHDLTVSAFIVNLDDEIILHHHKKYSDLYMQFGGHVELDEDPWTAILREIREEIGYDESQLDLYQPIMALLGGSAGPMRVFHPYPVAINTHPIGDDGHMHTDIAYAFNNRGNLPAHKPLKGESNEFYAFRWYPRHDPIEHMTAYHIPKNVLMIMSYVLTHVTPHWNRVSL